MSHPLIALNNITKSYQMGDIQLDALKNISLQIGRGEYVSILGPSGSGKSTLMNVLGCLDTPTQGHYLLDGQCVGELSGNELAQTRNKKIGFIFQSFNLLDFSSALENVALPLIYAGVKRGERLERAEAALQMVGLGDRIEHRPSELSGGQRQRVAVARALVTQPDIVLADEPTGNLDTHSGEAVIELFETLLAQKKTVIVVTHNLAMAERTHRILTIQDGELKGDQQTSSAKN